MLSFIYLCIIIFLKHKLELYLLNFCIHKSSIYLSIYVTRSEGLSELIIQGNFEGKRCCGQSKKM